MRSLLRCLLYQYTYDFILRYSWPSARRQRRLPSPLRNLKNICICRLLYKYSTHTVLYCILRFACPAARRQRRLPSPPRTVVVVIAQYIKDF